MHVTVESDRMVPNRGAQIGGSSSSSSRIPCDLPAISISSPLNVHVYPTHRAIDMPGPVGIDASDLSSNPRYLFRQPRALQWFEHGRLVKRHDCERQAGQ